MGSRYWVRHASLRGFVGPLSQTELAAASLPPDAEVRLARSDGRPETLGDHGWSPLHQLLGVAPPLPADPVIELPPLGIPGVRTSQVLAHVRNRSSYRVARRLASMVVVLALWTICIMWVAGLVEAVRAKNLWMLLGECATGGLKAAGAIVVYHAFAMLADIADCHLRRETELAVRSVAPSSPPS